MNKKNFIRLFFPDVRLAKDVVMRMQLEKEMRYVCDGKLAKESLYNIEAYNEIIRWVKKRHNSLLASKSQEYKDFLENSVYTEEQGSFDDYLYSFVVSGFRVDEYFLLELYNKNPKERLEYISDRDKRVISKGLNDIVDRAYIEYKHLTYNKISPLYHRNAIYLNHRNQVDEFKRFIDKHQSAVIKVSIEKEGAGIIPVYADQIENYEELYMEKIYGREVLLEEMIVQSKEMAALNPSTVNTVRVMTYNIRDGVVIPFCFLKTGRYGSFVDNAASGGVFADVDPETGIVSTNGFDEFGRSYSIHPDHGYFFSGLALPEWKNAIWVVSEAMKAFPTMGYIGWDIAHTEDGWVIVEGNSEGLYLPNQIALQRGIKEEIKHVVEKCSSSIVPSILERI